MKKIYDPNKIEVQVNGQKITGFIENKIEQEYVPKHNFPLSFEHKDKGFFTFYLCDCEKCLDEFNRLKK